MSKKGNSLDEPHLAEFKVLLDNLNRESPRGKVLIASALLDDLLRRTLEARMIDHPDVKKLTGGFNAPFGSFSARITGAWALGAISESEYHDLELIRKIRNEFAHSLTATFDDRCVIDRCAILKFSAKDHGEVVVSAAGQFVTAVVALVLNLVNRPHYVSRKRLTVETWPY